MTDISNFWDIGPHDSLPVEATWHEFVRSSNGKIVADFLSHPPSFNNADYFFPNMQIVAELKEIQTEFMASEASRKGFDALLHRLVAEDSQWRPALFGGDGSYPSWFRSEFIRLARPPISRILKKANLQIRETKIHFNISHPTGVLFFVNDGFTGLAPDIVHTLACDLLTNSYSSIDCFVYLTLNRYVELPDSNEPKLLWLPTYSDRADDSLVNFIDALGKKWFEFLEQKIGGFTSQSVTEDRSILRNSKAIALPEKSRG